MSKGNLRYVEKGLITENLQLPTLSLLLFL